MRKTILTIVMMLVMAITASAGPAIKTSPAKNPTNVEFKGDSIIVTDDGESVTVTGLPLQKVRDKINKALDDTLTSGSGTTVEFGDHKGELAPEDIKEISNQWASVVKQITINGSFCLLGLVALVLLFRFLNRRNKYRVIEKAIENNYPLDELSLTDVKHKAIYVQQPVVTAAPRAGQVPVGTPLEQGQTPSNPIVVNDVVNWRAMMPAVKWMAWGIVLFLFGCCVGDFENPFWPVGLALIFVGLCKGFILYKEQQALQDAWKRSQQMQPQEPMREGIPVPPPLDQDYQADDDDNQPYQPY